MNFRDELVTCGDCGKTFVFTVTEQRQLFQSGQDDRDPETDAVIPPPNCPGCRHKDGETGRWLGRIKWYSSEKGYGFIVKPNSNEVFFHRSQVMDAQPEALLEGVAVTFDEVVTDRGAEARQVKVGAG